MMPTNLPAAAVPSEEAMLEAAPPVRPESPLLNGLWQRALAAPTTPLEQFVRYLFVGGTAFVADFGTLALLKELAGLGVLSAAAGGFVVGTAVNYAISMRWVFTKRTLQNKRLEFLIFVGVGLVGLALNELFMWLLAENLSVHYLGAKLITTGAVLMWNFLGRKLTLSKG